MRKLYGQLIILVMYVTMFFMNSCDINPHFPFKVEVTYEIHYPDNLIVRCESYDIDMPSADPDNIICEVKRVRGGNYINIRKYG